jgi:hypothetical protein
VCGVEHQFISLVKNTSVIQNIGIETMTNSDYLVFIFKFILGALGFGVITHAIGNHIESFQVFVTPLDLIFIIALVYLNRNKFSEILTTLEN